MRWKVTLLALLSGWGLAGCLLAREKINRAPQVVIGDPAMPIVRSDFVRLRATVTDDQDRPDDLYVSWLVMPVGEDGCGYVTPEDFLPGKAVFLSSPDPFTYKIPSMDPLCVCARVADHQGAMAHACRQLQAENLAPVPLLKDAMGLASGVARPLYSHVRISAAGSTDPEGDPLTYEWDLRYSGADPAGQGIGLSPCPGALLAANTTTGDQERCFEATAPGAYEVRLRVADTVTVGGEPKTTWTDWTTFSFPVKPDAPPCIQRTSPDARAQRILLSRSLDLGGLYESRVFQVFSVADDGEPYPAGEGMTPARMIWYVFDPTQANPGWVRQTAEGPQFEVSQTRFPNAKPGDTVRIRLEVRDSLVDANYADWICPQSEDYCCAPDGCAGTSACLRWTTWTVQFQP